LSYFCIKNKKILANIDSAGNNIAAFIKLIECPRDAMQGIHDYIPFELKVKYINLLLKCGFDTIDFGSFVSPKAIPQLKDTTEVIDKLDVTSNGTKLLAIIANVRGAEEAAKFEKITYLGYPFSLSETFQQRNTNRSISVAHDDLKEMQSICIKTNKKLVVYFSMGFGNPYGDPWNTEIVSEWLDKLTKEDIKIFSLADTVGTANKEDIASVFKTVMGTYPNLEIGAHFHARPEERNAKISAAWDAGCRRFDMAMLGFGGCPMAEDELVGNISTEFMLGFLKEKNIQARINEEALAEAKIVASEIFGRYF
jgi:hydroxymethylglutaryl-CoA lyase